MAGAAIDVGEAARLLGVCERTFRRYVDRYEDEGLDGLVDRRLGQVSARRAPVDEVVRAEALYRERYDGWSVKHFYSFYRREHDGRRSYSWVKRTLQRVGLVRKAPDPDKTRSCGPDLPTPCTPPRWSVRGMRVRAQGVDKSGSRDPETVKLSSRWGSLQ